MRLNKVTSTKVENTGLVNKENKSFIKENININRCKVGHMQYTNGSAFV